MSSMAAKVLWVIAGLLIIAAGIVVICSPGGTILSLAFLLAIAMLISGISNFVAFARYRKEQFNAGWILADGILTTLLGILLLGNQLVTAAMIPYIFGIWVMISGILRIVNSTDLKKLGISSWGWVLASGIISVLCGFAALWNPVIAMIAISILLGVLFIIQGIMTISLAFTFRKY